MKNTLPNGSQAAAENPTTSAQGLRKVSRRLERDDSAVDAPLPPPDSRTRSIWLNQLVLAAAVVLTSVLVIALQPELFSQSALGPGVFAVIFITMATLVAPWPRLSRRHVFAVPLLDVVAIGLIASGTELRFSYFWVLPVMWVATHFTARELAGILAAITALLVIDTVLYPGFGTLLRVFIVIVSLSFIGITAHLATRRSRALRRLLQRQATRLHRTVDRRSEQERKTTEILNGVDTGIARLSLTGGVVAVNDTYAQLYGLDPFDLELPAKSVEYDDLRGMPLAPPQRPFARAQRGETFTDERVWLYTTDTEWRALSITSKRLEETAPEGTTMLLVVTDITAITHAQRERDRLTAIASHELKHPLTVMISTADLALESDDLTPAIRGRFEAMLRASERMLEMTSSMLRSSQTTLSSRPPFEEVDLRQILWESAESFRPAASAQEVALSLAAKHPLPVNGDGFRLRQVIDNLISNAIKYTPAGGQVQAEARVDGSSVVLVVSDTGIGIAEQDIPRISTPYFRTESAKGQARGTGLGLNITKEILAAHDGTLTIESELGTGTTIEVRLPLRPSATVEHDEVLR